MDVHSFNNSLYACTMHMRIYTYRQPHTMWQDFEGGVSWNELAKICSDILQRDFKVRQHFEEIWYIYGEKAHIALT